MLTRNILLWPATPNPESWASDTPNEGLQINVKEDPGIIDLFADYQGFDIISSQSVHMGLMFTRVHFAPTRNQEYLAAYKVILEEMECCWHNPLLKEAKWPKITARIVERLKGLGWREVKEETEKPDIYFRWKQC